MVKLKNVLIVTASLTIPVGAYTILLNRRLERRIKLVTTENLPKNLAKPITVPGKPTLNYIEGFYADLPVHKWSLSSAPTKIEDVAKVFFTTLPMRVEWNILSFVQWLGMDTLNNTVDLAAKDAPPFTKGKTVMNTFTVEKGLEQKNPNEIQLSYWMPSGYKPLFGGVHSLVCENLDNRTVRVWFVTHLALDSPCKSLVADETSRVTSWSKYFGYDPSIIDPSRPGEEIVKGSFKGLMWFHRLYSRILLDFTAREISMRK